jgi:hypothetical protein
MTEYIAREDVLLEYKRTEVEAILYKKSWQDTWKALGDNLKSIPVMVQCKECSYWEKAKVNKKGFLICPASGMEIMADDFCSYGERRTDER